MLTILAVLPATAYGFGSSIADRVQVCSSPTGHGSTQMLGSAPVFLLAPQVKLLKRLDRDAEKALDSVLGLFAGKWVEQRVGQ